MKVKPKFLCPTCRHYESEAYREKCKDCLKKPVDFRKIQTNTSTNQPAAKNARSKQRWTDNLDPTSAKFIVVCAILVLLALLYLGKDLQTAVMVSILGAPIFSFFVWVIGLVVWVILYSGYTEGRDYALNKGFHPVLAIFFGLLGVVGFFFIFG